MRWRGLLAAAVLLGSGTPGHAQYNNRLNELEPEVQAFGHPPLVQSIRGNVANEFARRNDGMDFEEYKRVVDFDKWASIDERFGA